MTLNDAIVRFSNEKVFGEKAEEASTNALNLLLTFFGGNKLIADIGTSELIEYRNWRAAQTTRYGKPPAPRTVNIGIEVFRRMIRYADDMWTDERVTIATGPTRKWGRIMLTTPKGRVRELQGDEQERLFKALRADYHPIVDFALLSGLRRTALLLRWSQIDLEHGKLSYARKSHRPDDYGLLPITGRMRELIEGQVGNDPEFVWTYVRRKQRSDRPDKRSPITYAGFGMAMKRAVRIAGLKDWRMIHDLRHTAASRIARSSRDIKAVQEILGHADIASTMVYVHLTQDHIRQAMETNPHTSPHKSPTSAARVAAAADSEL